MAILLSIRRPSPDATGRPARGDDRRTARAVAEGDQEAFVEIIVESLADEPANDSEITWSDRRRGQPDEGGGPLELGPNDCAAT